MHCSVNALDSGFCFLCITRTQSRIDECSSLEVHSSLEAHMSLFNGLTFLELDSKSYSISSI